MRIIVVVGALLAGCAHAGNHDFARQYGAVSSGAQLTGRSGPLVLTHVSDRVVQVTDLRTTKATLEQPASKETAELLQHNVKTAIAGDDKLGRDDIRVNASPNGTVTLVGRVQSQTEAARAVLDAFSVPGVHVVNTDLR